MFASCNKGLQEYGKKTKFYFDGTNKNSNQLCWYTHTRPQNETKLGRCVIYALKNLCMCLQIQSCMVRLLSCGKHSFMYQKSIWC